MAYGLNMALIDPDATPEVATAKLDAVPPGRWTRHWHFPRPVTPLYADFEFGSHLALSEIVAAAEYAAITGGRARHFGQFLVIDGFVYRGEAAGGSVPVGRAPVAPGGRDTGEPDRGYEWVALRRWREATRPAIVAALARFGSTPLDRLSDRDLRMHVRLLSLHLLEGWGLYFTVDAAANVVRRRAEAFCRERLGTSEAEFLELLSGSSPATSEPVSQMEALAETVRRSPGLRAALDQPGAWSDEAIRRLLRPYLEAYGHRASDWEYAGATLAERPDRAVRLLREAVSRATAGEAHAAAGVRRRRDAAAAAWRARLADDPQRAEFDRLLRDAQETFPYHEDNINLYMQATGYMRYALLEAGQRFTGRGWLAAPERILALRRSELEAALTGWPAPDLRRRAEARWEEYQGQRARHPPRTVDAPVTPAEAGTSPPLAAPPQEAAAAAVVAPSLEAAPASAAASVPFVLHGLGASPGTYTGKARVIIAEEQFEAVQPGEVLVCPQTSPSWTVLFGRIGALVTDEGGILSHAAIAAREFGLPAVLAARDATRLVAEGQVLRVDGSAGTVTAAT
jgi:pyruvate,water dikinase